MNIPQTRLFNQHLLGNKFNTPKEVVEHLGAVQAQDYPAAKWALGQRIKNANEKSVEQAFNNGEILRTHVMRPTWHFIPPEDVLWMQKATSKNVKRLMNSYNKKLELSDEIFKKTNKTITKALQKEDLTRQELKIILKNIGVETDVQRLAHIIMWAELDGLIISGPRRGKQFTYSLLEKRVKKSKKLSREESLASLAEKYFESHSPAQLKDFAWWSGLSIKDSTEALDFLKSKLILLEVNGKKYWHIQKSELKIQNTDSYFLLSIFDEYVISYKDRSDMGEQGDVERLLSFGNALTAVILINGKIAGTWKRKLKKGTVEISLSPFRKSSVKEKELLEKACYEYGRFLGQQPLIL